MFLKPQKIIFNSILQRYKLKNIKPNQSNNNQELIDQLEIDIKLNGLICPLYFCTETLVYVVKDNDMEKLLSKLNSYIWFDYQGNLDG